jgi:ribonuclease HI
MSTKLIIHTDGAAKGNPGPSGIGVAIYKEGDETNPIATLHEYIGEVTNNVAEYKAMIRGLSEALLRGADSIEARTDSELMARQIAGRYKVSSGPLIALHAEAKSLLARFDRARVVHIPREQNSLADKLANQGIAEYRDKQREARAPKSAPTPSPSAPPRIVEAPPRFAHTHSDVYGDERLYWDVERLWEIAKSLPVKKVPVAQLAAYLDKDCWFEGAPATIRQVADHAKRIYEADLSKPILLSAGGRLMDGGHRLARAYLIGLTELDAVQFERNPEPDARRPL